MNLPPKIQQQVEQWASSQGFSTEQFIAQAVAEKLAALSQGGAKEHPEQYDSQRTNALSSQQAKIYRKGGILVVDAELQPDFDINIFIDELRSERILDQMAL